LRRFLLIYMSGYAICADAGNIDYAQRLLKAKSASEIQSLQRMHDELQVARRACKLQLQDKSAPLACYDSLNLEIKWGMHPNRGQQKILREKLDHLCAESAQHLRIPRNFSSAVSPRCRLYLAEAHRVRLYRENRPDWSEN
jgi:hypothetical protein